MVDSMPGWAKVIGRQVSQTYPTTFSSNMDARDIYIYFITIYKHFYYTHWLLIITNLKEVVGNCFLSDHHQIGYKTRHVKYMHSQPKMIIVGKTFTDLT